MSIRGRLDKLEQSFGPAPGAVLAVADAAGRIVQLLTAGLWGAAPDDMTAADLPDGCKVYVGFDPAEV